MKKKRGDRRDGRLLRDIDSMHYIMPLMMPNRCDNEAFFSVLVDLTNINKYLEKKNQDNPAYHFNLFHVLVTAILKTITLRPKMNYFIANYHMYERNEVSAAFTIKKIFADNGEEDLAFIHSKPTDTINNIHDEIYRQVSEVRIENKKDSSSESMDTLQKLPLFLKKFIGAGARYLDRRGKMPKSVIETDPYQSSVVIANLGSIGLNGVYHHLTNWGTTSMFCTIGKHEKRWFRNNDGTGELKDSVDLGLIIDERVADGFYYSRTLKLLITILQNPEVLEKPLSEKIEY
ncbi:MAG: hypothetical protein IKF90_24610 [Parasporobacterium sp.]|nr:hypothetical protein [Parasporobacterium sp.]